LHYPLDMCSFNPGAIKALALDLDGTILQSGAVLGKRTVLTLRRAMDRGLRVILCTGRSPESAEKYRALINAQGPMIYFNGAMAADMPGGSIVNTVFLSNEIVAFCAETALGLKVYFQSYFSRKSDFLRAALFSCGSGPEAELYRAHTGSLAQPADMGIFPEDPQYAGCLKGMFITGTEQMDEIRSRLLRRFGESVSITKSSPLFLEVLAQGVSKGSALSLIMERLGLKPEEVIAFGDEENDLPMFKAALHSAAPANAVPAVLSAAEFTVGSCDDEGVAAFLEKEILR
jgi:Cof subfamily protein (haloacid dehalogenase superfamily)